MFGARNLRFPEWVDGPGFEFEDLVSDRNLAEDL